MAAGLDIDKVVNDALKQLGSNIDKRLRTRFKSSMIDELKKSLVVAGTAFRAVMEEQYDILIGIEDRGSGPLARAEDPTSLSRFKSVFSNQIERDVKNIRFEGDTVTISVGDLEEWGLDGNQENSDHELYFLSYYIEGVVGEHGFLPIEVHNLGHAQNDGGGKFGSGFMISKENYVNEKWEEKTGVPFSQIKHAVSGQPPFTGFNIAAENFDWSPYICQAIQKAFERTFEGKIS
jgi:hypothetical protein